MPTYTGSTVISGGTLNFALGTNSGNLFTTRTNTISGSGNLAVSAAQILLTNSISLGGSQSYIQTGPTNYGYILVGGAVTLSGSSITLSGDLGAASTNGTSLTLNTSSNNGAINLNISDGWSSLTNIAYGVSLTANAGTGTITWSGTGNATGGLAGGYPAIWASPVTLIGAVNITAPIYMGVNPSLAQISGTAYIGTDTLTINSTANGTISGTLNDYQTGTSPMALIKTGSATLTITSSNGYSGGTILDAGTIAISNNAALGIGTVTFASNAAIVALTNLTLTNAEVISNGVSATLNNNGYSLTNQGVISGAGGLTSIGAGTLTLTAANTYSGGTTLNAGTLAISNNASLGTGTLTYGGNGTLTALTTLSALTNASVINSGVTATVNNNGFAMTNSGVISGAGGLTSMGTGTLALTGTNTFTGTTTVASGTLSLGTTGKLSSTTNVVINSGGTLLLGGNNQLTTNSALTLGGGTLSLGGGATRAGSNSLGTLTLTSNSVIDFSALSGNSSLSFANILGLGTYKLTILDWNGTTAWGTIVGGGTTTQLLDAGSLTATQLSNISFYSGSVTNSGFLGTGVFAGSQIIPVPEPRVVIAGGLLLGWLIFSSFPRLRRKKMASRQE
jgi:autotransporter-associated beta strand protein